VALGLAGNSVVGKAVLGFTTGNMASAKVDISLRNAARADVDGAGVGGVEVGSDRGLLREGQVALNLVDDLGVGLHVDGGGGVALLGGNHCDIWVDRDLVWKRRGDNV
jgi:hypothetical protein